MASTDRPGEYDSDGMTAPILGEPRKYTSHDAAMAARVSPQFAHRYWLASGYAVVDDNAVEFTESDVAALRLMAGYIAQGIATEHGLLQVIRLMGRTLSRLVESQVDVVLERLDDPDPSDTGPARQRIRAGRTAVTSRRPGGIDGCADHVVSPRPRW
ncbi:hypothetical protein SAMN06265360_12263 [Haloechinothrix alba]|uniref:MerR HTH family regulatory protein n=1 Tax=Haloechinothrix alba TaxID=664784 RepID=A0A238ZMK1_9PSEU|nr:hypothetical protein [Haloechinothrix alba]SNR84402.1 hypothetical protein SAMN06265360_12263 [Haloechinothrix alba]